MCNVDKKNIISRMTLRQKADFLTGKNFWETKNYEEYGVPSITLSDGPHGIRKQVASADHIGMNASLPATCFPTAAAMANSWNSELCERAGEALGREAAAYGVNVLLGPGICIKRDPRCGRNFEYFSEDPYLAGKMAAAYVRGIQKNGTAACVKHFAANNREEARMVSDSVMDERTLREIYLTAFEIAVKEGETKAVMSSYNKVNGTYADENAHLIRDILRGEWGFDGVVVSDWSGTNDKVASTVAGSDLEMPACRYGADDIVKAVESGGLDIKLVDESVERILALIEGAVAEKTAGYDSEALHKLAAKCAEESIVLLKNDGILPLKENTKVALIGDFAKSPRYQGAGSSVVNPTKLENLLDSLAGLECVGYEKGFHRYGKDKPKLIRRAVKLAKRADVAILCLGLDELTEAEGLDRTDIKIPENQIELFRQIRVFCKKVVVVLFCGSAVETGWCRSANGIIYASLGGQAGASAIAGVLTGRVNPSGKLAETFPVKLENCATADIFKKNLTVNEYREGLFVGYRYYDAAKVPVAYPFGYGLSYTEFEYSNAVADENGVTFKITNVGSYDGAEIAQLYVGKNGGAVFRPVKELKGFKKIFLKSGESAAVHIPFDDKTFRYFNVKTDKWEVEGGEYLIYIGASSTDIRLTACVEKIGTTDLNPYDKEMLPSYYSGKVGSVTDGEFAALSGKEGITPGRDFYKKNRMIITANTTVSDLRYSKRWIGRAFSRIVRFLIIFLKRIGKRQAANFLIMGMLRLPVRGLAKFAGFNRRQTEGLIMIFNGHFFKGARQMLKRNKNAAEK